MKNLVYKNQVYNAKELSDLTGIKYGTLCDRLRRGYTVEEAIADQQRIPESIIEFVQASHPPDWEGHVNEEIYFQYMRWCENHEPKFEYESIVHFMRSLKKAVPTLRVVPSRIKNKYGIFYKRVIRVD